jgi:hypothetical protein
MMTDIDPAAFLVGRVEMAYGVNPADSRVADLKPFISKDGNVIRTTHGQLELNREIGLLRIDAPKAQGVVGFLAAAGGAFDLTDVTVRCSNDFASILVVPLDQQPLASSRKIFVQVGTQSFPTGWETKPAHWETKGRQLEGVEIVSTGELPWQITDINASLTLRNTHVEHAILLDENGYYASEVDLQRKDERITLSLPRNTLYLVVEGNSPLAGRSLPRQVPRCAIPSPEPPATIRRRARRRTNLR